MLRSIVFITCSDILAHLKAESLILNQDILKKNNLNSESSLVFRLNQFQYIFDLISTHALISYSFL